MLNTENYIAEIASNSIRPIYRNKRHRPEQLGTCTFINIDSNDYLVTAAHVLDNPDGHSLFVGQNGLVPVNLKFHSTVPKTRNRLNDKIDFAFARIDKSWRERGVDPIKASNLVERDDALIYSATGFPNSRNRKYNPVRMTVRPTVRQFISSPTKNYLLFAAAGLSIDTHLVLHRPNKYGFSGRQQVHLFEPRGMSGGMMFGIYAITRPEVLAGRDLPTIIPAAIITERNIKNQILFGTRISVIVEAIRQETSRARRF